jgi:hypothetical protein
MQWLHPEPAAKTSQFVQGANSIKCSGYIQNQQQKHHSLQEKKQNMRQFLVIS